MGKTVESYRMAIEDEIRRWDGFAKTLRKEDREAFNTLIDACRNYASAGSNATQPLPLEPMIMSMLVSQQIRLQRLQKELNDLSKSNKSAKVCQSIATDSPTKRLKSKTLQEAYQKAAYIYQFLLSKSYAQVPMLSDPCSCTHAVE